jgi:hypothetical protein
MTVCEYNSDDQNALISRKHFSRFSHSQSWDPNYEVTGSKMIKILVFALLAVVIIAMVQAHPKMDPAKKARFDLVNKKMCESPAEKQILAEKCCMMNKMMGDKIADKCKDEVFKMNAAARVKKMCERQNRDPAGGGGPGGKDGPRGGGRGKMQEMFECAIAEDPKIKDKITEFFNKPDAEKEKEFDDMIKCREDKLA